MREEPKKSHEINVLTLENIVNKINDKTHLIHISTDHLFNGKASYYDEKDIPAPLNEYARTKLLAEKYCLSNHKNTTIVRTNIIGKSPVYHKDTFAEWILSSLKQEKNINLFNDYFFTPIEVNLLAKALNPIIDNSEFGVFNIVGIDRCSKYEFGIMLAKAFSLDKSLIIESKISDFSFFATRPKDLSLSTKKYTQVFKSILPDLASSINAFYLSFQAN